MPKNYFKSKGIWGWSIVSWIILSQVVTYIVIFLINGFNEESNRFCIRFTARLGVLIFCTAFMASSVQLLYKNAFTFWWMMNRKFIGISFAITHLMHLFFLGMLQYFFHPVFELAQPISLLGGGLAYLFVVAMLITSFPRYEKMLYQNHWKILHTVGGYWIWFIFARSYVRKVLAGHHEFWPYVILLIIVFLLRVNRILRTKKIIS